MDALTAFRTFCQPQPGADAAQLRAECEQAQALFDHAKQATQGLHMDGLDQGDRISAISTVLLRIRTTGPRGVRPGDPETAEQLGWFLRRAVKNEMRSRVEENSGLYRVADSIDDDTAERRLMPLLAHIPTPLQAVLAAERHQLAAEAYTLARRLLDQAIAQTGARKRSKGQRWADEFANLIGEFIRVASGETTLVELARRRVAGRPRVLTPSMARRCAQAGWAWQTWHLQSLRDRGLTIAVEAPAVVRTPDGSAEETLQAEALWRAVVAAAEADERVALDQRFKNYRDAVLAEIAVQHAAGALTQAEANLARHGVDQFLFIQPRAAG